MRGKRGDTATVLSLMTDDPIFMVPAREPFDKEIFVAAAQEMAGVNVDGANEIVELQLLGDWAFMRGRIDMTGRRRTGSRCTIGR